MLAKLWKKFLLAVCIVACIFNIMIKLVSRNSLEVNLKSANDGNTVFDFTRKDSQEKGPGFIEEVQQLMKEENEKANNSQNVVVNQNVSDDKNSQEEQPSEKEENQNEEPSNENKSNSVNFKDYTFVELF